MAPGDGAPAALGQSLGPLKIRTVEAGAVSNAAPFRGGRGHSTPPQFGQLPISTSVLQVAQKVHSNEQI